MIFEENKLYEKIGKVLGFLVSYALFTVILYFILIYLGKIPEDWNILHIVLITFFIIIIGKLIKRLLK